MKIEKKEPKKPRGILYVRVPEDLLAKLKKKAAENNYSLSEYATEMIKQFVK